MDYKHTCQLENTHLQDNYIDFIGIPFISSDTSTKNKKTINTAVTNSNETTNDVCNSWLVRERLLCQNNFGGKKRIFGIIWHFN